MVVTAIKSLWLLPVEEFSFLFIDMQGLKQDYKALELLSVFISP